VSTKIQEFISGESKAKTPPPAKPHKMSELNSPLQELTKALHEEIQKGQVQVTMESRGLVISLKQAAFFPTGDSTIAVSGYPTIEKVARTLLKVPNPVRLEGHTDSIPISNVHYRSNWHLSSARSIAMLDLLTMKFRIPAERLAVVGYGDTVPIDGNETETGRARNRRVDITVLNDSSFTAEPQPGAKLTAAAQPQSVMRTP
jgi:chemotaxis protein MotB